jgi:hypothetical protein
MMPEELRAMLMQTGMGMMAQSDQPYSTVLGNLGRALPAGVQAGRQAASKAQWDRIVADAPPQMRELWRMIGPERGPEYMMEMMTAPPPKRDIQEGVEGQFFEFGQDGGVTELTPAPVKPADVPDQWQNFEFYSKLDDAGKASFAEFMAAQRGPSTTVNVNGEQDPRLQALAQQEATFITDGYSAARASLDRVGTIANLSKLTESDAFQRVSGPIQGRFGELAATVSGDVDALEAIAEFRTGGGMMTIEQLKAFTGPKTEQEYRWAQQLVLNDPTLTPEQIRRGLALHRRVAEQEAVRWADRMLELAPGYENPATIAPQMELARSIKSRFGNAGVNDPAGIRQ